MRGLRSRAALVVAIAVLAAGAVTANATTTGGAPTSMRLLRTYGDYTIWTNALLQAGPCTGMGGNCTGPEYSYYAWQYRLGFSGRIVIGSSLYQGDLVSDWSAWQDNNVTLPKFSMRGNTGGHWVRGYCTARPGGPFGGVTGGARITCNLGLDGAPWVHVHLVTGETNWGSRTSADHTKEYDFDTGEFFRDQNGYYATCKPGLYLDLLC